MSDVAYLPFPQSRFPASIGGRHRVAAQVFAMSAGADIAAVVRELLARAPEWVRIDLASKDATTRARAEETLAAMIEAALNKDGIVPAGDALVGDGE
jgi:hypothetical protein